MRLRICWFHFYWFKIDRMDHAMKNAPFLSIIAFFTLRFLWYFFHISTLFLAKIGLRTTSARLWPRSVPAPEALWVDWFDSYTPTPLGLMTFSVVFGPEGGLDSELESESLESTLAVDSGPSGSTLYNNQIVCAFDLRLIHKVPCGLTYIHGLTTVFSDSIWEPKK